MDELLGVLRQEKQGYVTLAGFAEEKRECIIKGDVDKLDAISEKEQDETAVLKNLEHKRVKILKDMAVVLGKDGEEISISNMIEMLERQPGEQAKLIQAKDELVQQASEMQLANQQNEILLRHAMEMVEFDLTLLKSLKQAPETANYDRNAYNTGDILGNSGFDTKQ
ncbi:MAG: flagellar protein FlgN [Lachnospiraceae bacterium]|nr:flagellar protein FlgN [Lachnospiraceae bacterium]